MIDLKCYLLGRASRDSGHNTDALELCRLAADSGVRTIVATRRWEEHEGEPHLPFVECRRRLAFLQREMHRALTIKYGFNVLYSDKLPSLLERHGADMALNGGRYVLVTLPPLNAVSDTERTWERVNALGYFMLLARPECSLEFRRHPAHLEQWMARRVMIQIDAASITGAHGREVRRFALECVRKYKGQVAVASNASVETPHRFLLSAARDELARRFGSRLASLLTDEAPAAILNGELMPGRITFSRRFLSLFRSKRFTTNTTAAS